ncbi:hypothetical protein L209DRAFT_397511 [Thermothelomyces heterothallicus CBS 203.75]
MRTAAWIGRRFNQFLEAQSFGYTQAAWWRATCFAAVEPRGSEIARHCLGPVPQQPQKYVWAYALYYSEQGSVRAIVIAASNRASWLTSSTTTNTCPLAEPLPQDQSAGNN